MSIPTGGPWNMRDTVAQWIQQSPIMQALGLGPESVFQADTTESPKARPFVVLRWGDQEAILGSSQVHPVDGWVYDDFGDYTRATNIAKAISEMLADEMVDFKTIDGRISQVANRGVGGDLADDGFKALVKPFRIGVVGNGS